MSLDIHNQYTGKMFGQDRIGHTTPDLEASDSYRPWLPVAFPAPWLPGLRQDQGHPKNATKVLSSQMLVGLDKSGALVPAGLVCGNTGDNDDHATGGGYSWIKYAAGSMDTWAVNPLTGNQIGPAGALVILACPNNAAAGDVLTLADGSTHTVTSGEITAAKACNLFPTGVVRPIGVATRDVYQYIGGTKVASTTGGILYTLDPMNPIGFAAVHNYTHEMGTAIQTDYVIRVPLVGASRYALTALAASHSVAGFSQGYGLSFTHYTGVPKHGNLVVGSREIGDAGNYSDYDSTKHNLADVCGRVLGVMNMVDKIGYMSRVKALWDPSRMVGPYKDPNPASTMMGGSATAGLPYDINLTTDGLYKLFKDQKADPTGHAELGSYVLIRILL